jgi:hypothetical protein
LRNHDGHLLFLDCFETRLGKPLWKLSPNRRASGRAEPVVLTVARALLAFAFICTCGPKPDELRAIPSRVTVPGRGEKPSRPTPCVTGARPRATSIGHAMLNLRAGGLLRQVSRKRLCVFAPRFIVRRPKSKRGISKSSAVIIVSCASVGPREYRPSQESNPPTFAPDKVVAKM